MDTLSEIIDKRKWNGYLCKEKIGLMLYNDIITKKKE